VTAAVLCRIGTWVHARGTGSRRLTNGQRERVLCHIDSDELRWLIKIILCPIQRSAIIDSHRSEEENTMPRYAHGSAAFGDLLRGDESLMTALALGSAS
jgi:hypothetical protein